MNSTLSLVSSASVWIGVTVTVVGLAGCDRAADRLVTASDGVQAVSDPPHPCRSRDAMTTQKGCRPAIQTVGTK